jgi:hypothetical protein
LPIGSVEHYLCSPALAPFGGIEADSPARDRSPAQRARSYDPFSTPHAWPLVAKPAYHRPGCVGTELPIVLRARHDGQLAGIEQIGSGRS